MPDKNKEQREKLLQLMHEMLRRDKELREKHRIGEKFRFVRDRLNALAARIEEGLDILEKESEKAVDRLLEDDVVVYIYLYNAQGLVLKTWQKMLNPAVFYEYSVNRPIYTNKTHADAFIRSKTNKVQHGYLAVAIKKQDILSGEGADLFRDTIGNLLVKVREGSLKLERLVSFTHNGHEYVVKEDGEFEKKS